VKPLELLGNAVRAKEILAVLARHGFADLATTLDRRGGLIGRLTPDPGPRRSKWERIRMAAEELGPAWVKFGQLLSMRPDLIPHPLILELRKLQDSVAPVTFVEMREVLVDELEAEPSEVFSEFADVPVASASLAQVYFARLKATGEPVAVKVQRPNIARSIHADLELAAWFASHLHNRENLRPYDLPSVVEAVREGVEQELDFRNEARNQSYFNTTNPVPEHVFAPRVYHLYTTPRVLVMERIEGNRADSVAVPPEMAKELAAHGARSFVHQVLLAGFFHADPHAGNVFITLDGRLCFLDWGLAGHLTRRLRYALADFWIAAVEGDAESIVRIAGELAPPGSRCGRS
jgi:ubiquinone biosynthesis protein